MADMAERRNRVEQRLEGVATGLTEVRMEVADLRTEVGGLRKLDEIARALEPLAELHAVIRVVAPEHENRIKALEDRVRSSGSAFLSVLVC